jgi:hypothetical protein
MVKCQESKEKYTTGEVQQPEGDAEGVNPWDFLSEEWV